MSDEEFITLWWLQFGEEWVEPEDYEPFKDNAQVSDSAYYLTRLAERNRGVEHDAINKWRILKSV